jgi:hypothetical protein
MIAARKRATGRSVLDLIQGCTIKPNMVDFICAACVVVLLAAHKKGKYATVAHDSEHESAAQSRMIKLCLSH